MCLPCCALLAVVPQFGQVLSAAAACSRLLAEPLCRYRVPLSRDAVLLQEQLQVLQQQHQRFQRDVGAIIEQKNAQLQQLQDENLRLSRHSAEVCLAAHSCPTAFWQPSAAASSLACPSIWSTMLSGTLHRGLSWLHPPRVSGNLGGCKPDVQCCSGLH